jgi:hypothetical protein
MIKKALMIFLFLIDINCIFASSNQSSDIQALIVSLLLIIGWWRHFPLIGLSIIKLNLSKLGPHLLKANLIKSQAPHLHFQILILSKIASFIKLRVYLFFNNEFLS